MLSFQLGFVNPLVPLEVSLSVCLKDYNSK